MPPDTASAVATRIDVDVARTLGLGGGAKVRRWLIRGVLVLAALAAATLIVRWWRARSATTPPSYVTAPIARGDLTITVTATGTLEPRELVEIGSEVSGRIEQVRVDANSRVTKGQVLAEIDPETIEAQVEQAAASLAQAKAQLVQAQATQREARQSKARVAGLVAAGVSSEQDRDAADAAAARGDAAVGLARAAVKQAEATLRVAHTNLGRTSIRSPIDGIVLERDVEAGQTVVAAFQSVTLFQLAPDLRFMKVSVDVDEADVGMVREGQAATFTVAAYVDRTFDAKVTSVHNAARLVDKVVTYEAELTVDNADLALRPGMTVTADIVARRIDAALLVPAQALRFTPEGAAAVEGDHIWVMRDGKPVAVTVTVLGHNDTDAAISGDGLADGDTVLVNTRMP